MGYLMSAECRCGFQTEVPFGAGRSDFRSRCSFPCYCNHCESLVAVNLLAPAASCPSCGAAEPKRYDQSSLHEGGTGQPIASWSLAQEELQLTDTRYRCPGCRTLSLRFHVEMLFD